MKIIIIQDVYCLLKSIKTTCIFIFICLDFGAAKYSTFRKIWNQLTPHVVITKPNLCWKCQRNNNVVYKSATFPDDQMSDRFKEQEKHLEHVCLVFKRTLYQEIVRTAKGVAEGLRRGSNIPAAET